MRADGLAGECRLLGDLRQTDGTLGPLLWDHLVTMGVHINSSRTICALVAVLIGPQKRCFGQVCTSVGGNSLACRVQFPTTLLLSL